MTDDSSRQAILDQEHLKLLSLLHWVSAGIDAFGSLFGLLYAFFGIAMSETISPWRLRC